MGRWKAGRHEEDLERDASGYRSNMQQGLCQCQFPPKKIVRASCQSMSVHVPPRSCCKLDQRNYHSRFQERVSQTPAIQESPLTRGIRRCQCGRASRNTLIQQRSPVPGRPGSRKVARVNRKEGTANLKGEVMRRVAVKCVVWSGG